jgi:hypothetical protein
VRADWIKCRKAFNTEELVYIHGVGEGNWVKADLCIWNGPDYLRHTPCLEDFYLEHQEFFRHTLGVPNATWKTLVEEAKHIEVTDSPKYISQVFVALNKYLEKGHDAFTPLPLRLKPSNKALSEAPSLAGGLEAFTQAAIFPIQTGDSKYNFHHLSTCLGREIWFIADRWHLRQSFEGLVPLLALEVESVEKISYLIKRLKFEDRLLSQVAHGVPKIRGLSHPCHQHTLSLREKSRSIAR